MEDTCAEVKSVAAGCREAKDGTTAALKKMDRKVASFDKKVDDVKEEVESLNAEATVLRQLVKKGTAQCKECREIQSRTETRENMICDFVDIVRESENLTRQQYIRTIYDCTLSKEISKASLSVLEQSLGVLRNVKERERGTIGA